MEKFPVRPPFKKLAGKQGKKTPMGDFFSCFPANFPNGGKSGITLKFGKVGKVPKRATNKLCHSNRLFSLFKDRLFSNSPAL